MCVPFLAVSLVYLWFSLVDVDIEIRAAHARIGIFSIALPQAIILIILSYKNRGSHARPE